VSLFDTDEHILSSVKLEQIIRQAYEEHPDVKANRKEVILVDLLFDKSTKEISAVVELSPVIEVDEDAEPEDELRQLPDDGSGVTAVDWDVNEQF